MYYYCAWQLFFGLDVRWIPGPFNHCAARSFPSCFSCININLTDRLSEWRAEMIQRRKTICVISHTLIAQYSFKNVLGAEEHWCLSVHSRTEPLGQRSWRGTVYWNGVYQDQPTSLIISLELICLWERPILGFKMTQKLDVLGLKRVKGKKMS